MKLEERAHLNPCRVRNVGGSGNLVQDLLHPVVVLVKKIKLDPNHSPQPPPSSAPLGQILDKTSQNVVCCSICEGHSQIRPLTGREVDLFAELMGQVKINVKAQVNLSQVLHHLCKLCSKSLEKLIKLREESDNISTCFRTAVRIQLDKYGERNRKATSGVGEGHGQRQEPELDCLVPKIEVDGDDLIPLQIQRNELDEDCKSEIMVGECQADGDMMGLLPPDKGMDVDVKPEIEEIKIGADVDPNGEKEPCIILEEVRIKSEDEEEPVNSVIGEVTLSQLSTILRPTRKNRKRKRVSEAEVRSLEPQPVICKNVSETTPIMPTPTPPTDENEGEGGGLPSRRKRQCRIMAEEKLLNIIKKSENVDGSSGSEDEESCDKDSDFEADLDTDISGNGNELSSCDGDYACEEDKEDIDPTNPEECVDGELGDLEEGGSGKNNAGTRNKCKCGKVFTNRSHLIRHQLSNGIRNRKGKPEGTELDPFICEVCREAFCSESRLEKHRASWKHFLGTKCRKVADNAKDVSFACDNCELEFIQVADLLSHKRVLHPDEKTMCEPCKKGYSQSQFERYKEHLVSTEHIRNVGGEAALLVLEKQKNFDCPKCTKKFLTARKLRKHQNVHSRPFMCEICGRGFANSTGMNYHLTTHVDKPKVIRKKADRFVAPKDKPFSCKVCFKRFADKSGMYRHLKVTHKGFRYKCDLCPSDFASLQMLKNHKLKVHDAVRDENSAVAVADEPKPSKPKALNPYQDKTRYLCDICPRTLVGKNNLGRHMELKHFPFKTACPYGCPDKVENEKEWMLHLEQCKSEKMTDTSKCYCFFCGEVFSNQLLKIAHHLHDHKSYPCEFCKKSFTRKDILAQHIYEHEEAKPFLCPKCGKRFRQQYNLDIHSTTVCGDDEDAKIAMIEKRRELHRIYREKAKPHKCDDCLKSFVQERRLEDHKQKVHLNDTKNNLEDEETENEDPPEELK